MINRAAGSRNTAGQVLASVHHLRVGRDDSSEELRRSVESFTSNFGVDVTRELAAFLTKAEHGSMIEVRRDRDGFSAQTTEGVVKGLSQSPTPRGILELAHELDQPPRP